MQLNTYIDSTFCWSLILAIFLGSRMQVSVSGLTVSVEEWVDIQESTVMTCSESGIIQIEWIRSALDAGSSAGADLIFRYNGAITPGSGINESRYEFDPSGNFPLTIKSVELGDERRYWCKVIADPGEVEDSGPLMIRVPVDSTTMYMSYNGNTYTGNDGSIDILAGTKCASFDCTAPGIKPGATVFVWTLDDSPETSCKGLLTQSPNGAANRLTDSTSTFRRDIPYNSSKPLRLRCATTNRQDGSNETEASISVTLNLIDPCQNNPCENDGTCTNWNGMPNCTCTEQFTGVNCNKTAPDGLSGGAIAGIVIGAVAAVALVIGIGVFIHSKHPGTAVQPAVVDGSHNKPSNGDAVRGVKKKEDG